MAKLPGAFNSADHDKVGEFKAIPAGYYIAQIMKSEMKFTQSGNGEYLELQFKVLEGEYSGRLLWNRLNLVNPNAVTVEIANKHLASICESCGVLKIDDSEELHGIPMKVRVGVKAANAQFPESNEIKGYKSADESTPSPGPTTGQAPLPWQG